MYSVVLMAALTTGGNVADCHHRGGCHGCSGCHGYAGCHGCNGCYGCYGCYGCSGWAPGSPMAPVGVVPEKAPPPKVEGKETSLPGKARLLVELPQGAKLYIDDQLMKNTATKRTFNTPALEAGQQYYYIVRAEVEIAGKTYTE